MINLFLELLFLMMAGHALADFPLQPAGLNRAKWGLDPNIPWYMALGCHSLIHGGFVAVITGVWWLGVAETIMHMIIDGAKIRGWFGMKIDQALHIGCKVVWALVVVI